MTDDSWDEQDNNQCGQEPNWTNDQRRRQRQINCAHCQERKQRLPARFRLVDMILLVHHKLAAPGAFWPISVILLRGCP